VNEGEHRHSPLNIGSEHRGLSKTRTTGGISLTLTKKKGHVPFQGKRHVNGTIQRGREERREVTVVSKKRKVPYSVVRREGSFAKKKPSQLIKKDDVQGSEEEFRR